MGLRELIKRKQEKKRIKQEKKRIKQEDERIKQDNEKRYKSFAAEKKMYSSKSHLIIEDSNWNKTIICGNCKKEMYSYRKDDDYSYDREEKYSGYTLDTLICPSCNVLWREEKRTFTNRNGSREQESIIRDYCLKSPDAQHDYSKDCDVCWNCGEVRKSEFGTFHRWSEESKICSICGKKNED